MDSNFLDWFAVFGYIIFLGSVSWFVLNTKPKK